MTASSQHALLDQDTLANVLAQTRDAVMSRIRDANQLTEKEILAVGAALNSIVQEARAHVADSSQALERITSASVTGLMQRQTELVATYIGVLSQQISEQAATTAQAIEQLNRILEVGEIIARVSTEARMLALNANIEASRLGAAGAAIRVIGQEMKRFSESVNRANTTVQDIAAELLETLPRIAQLAETMTDGSRSFSSNVNHHLQGLSKTSAEMKEVVAEMHQMGDVRLSRVLKASQDALSHLQFQDTLAQSLLGCEGKLNEATHVLSQLLQGPGTSDGSSEVALQLPSLPPVQPAETEPDIEAGEVMLF